MSTVYTVVFFDSLEYQRRPIFADRDAGIVYGWTDPDEAKAEAASKQDGEVVPFYALPRTVAKAYRFTHDHCRRCGWKYVYGDGLCNACFCI